MNYLYRNAMRDKVAAMIEAGYFGGYLYHQDYDKQAVRLHFSDLMDMAAKSSKGPKGVYGTAEQLYRILKLTSNRYQPYKKQFEALHAMNRLSNLRTEVAKKALKTGQFTGSGKLDIAGRRIGNNYSKNYSYNNPQRLFDIIRNNDARVKQMDAFLSKHQPVNSNNANAMAALQDFTAQYLP